MVKDLMTARRFAALFWTQFFTALNDNFAKNALVILIVFSIDGNGGGALATLAGVILMAPFFVLSALGGIYFLPIDLWIKGYMLMGVMMLVSSTVTITKTIRDVHEADKLVNKIEDAKTEQLLMRIDRGKE